MNAYLPLQRHRGYFLENPTEPEASETESAEGITFRVRIIRPLRRRAALAARAAGTRTAASRRYHSNKRKASANDR